MQHMREWIICLTLCSFGCSIVYTLVPRGAMEKSMKTVISLFLISALAAPLSQLVKNGVQFDVPQPEYTFGYAEQVNSTLISAAESAVKQVIVEAIPELSQSETFIDVSAAADSENEVFIEYVRIRLNNPALSPADISDKIFDKLQLTAEVTE